MVAMLSLRSDGPYRSVMPMQPSPSSETTGPVEPSWWVRMFYVVDRIRDIASIRGRGNCRESSTDLDTNFTNKNDESNPTRSERVRASSSIGTFFLVVL